MPPARRRPKPKPKPRSKPRRPPLARRTGAAACRSSSSATSTSSGSAWSPTAIFFAFVVYLGLGRRPGGRRRRRRACGSLIGAGHYLVPAALMAAGAILVLRPVLPAVRPFKAGASACSPRSASASPPARSGSARAAARSSWDAEWVKPRGGVVGEGLYWATSTALGDLGAHTIALFLLHRRRAAAHGRLGRGRGQGHERLDLHHHARGPHRRPAPPPGRPRSCPRSSSARRRASTAIARTLPEHEDDAARRARRRRGPRADRRMVRAARSCPQLDEEPRLAEDPETDEPGVARTTPDRGAPHAPGPLPRRGDRLARLRVDDPRHRLPQALERRGEPARHRRAGEGRRPADRGARPLRRRGARHRHGRGPAHHPLRAAPRARHQGRQGRPAQGRPRLRAGRLGHPHPRPDPRQAGGRRRGPQRAPPDRPPRRRAAGDARRAGRR